MSQAASLFELNNMVRESLEATFSESYWVCAEISQISVAANRHCYLELVERSPRQGLIAQARAHIWRENYTLIANEFRRVTGGNLEAGMKILVEVEICFHEQYGYSLNIMDIDPSFSLGDMARRRQETIARLQDEGVFELNKQLTMPRPLSRLAIISAETAAGYGDFMQQLSQSGYHFHLQLFPCAMQGRQAAADIVEALEQIAQDDQWEAVVIIRGGGSVVDLSAFDDYELASNVAQFPLPVLTGIGHERDESVVDLVAHSRLKTPTAVAAYLIALRQSEYDTVEGLADALRQKALQIVQQHNARLQQLLLRYNVAHLRFLQLQRSRLRELEYALSQQALRIVGTENLRVETARARMQKAAVQALADEKNKITDLQHRLTVNDPRQMLRRGYSITTSDGHIVRDVKDLVPGAKIRTQMAVGIIDSTVERVEPNPEFDPLSETNLPN